MTNRQRRLLAVSLFCLLSTLTGVCQLVPGIALVGSARTWTRAEFRLINIPASTNPFDPDLIRVDGTFAAPSGQATTVPAFWYQGYQRSLSGGTESLATVGAAEWRLRFTPAESGVYTLSVQVRTNNQVYGTPGAKSFTVAADSPARAGYVRLAADKQYFETGDGQPLPLVGENVCWHGARGTYDYDDWFPALVAAGGNYARLWMCPWAFGIETEANSLTRYRQDKAWRLDYVFQLAESKGIYLLLCLDYHGMFETAPDYWGGNNYWPANPYNVANGGPCANQDAFFTNSVAKATYEKRLRYLVGRYGYSPNLLAWQFFNEIDNVYSYLRPADVAAWHAQLGAWVHANDPFKHLVTTSVTGSSDRPEIWSLPQMDYANYHSYGEPGPASRLGSVTTDFRQRYRKPVVIDEFGTDWRGWNRPNDPYLRGFRQGLWGGALGGSAGTSMPWFWENIHSENGYPAFAGLKSILAPTGWGRGPWAPLAFVTPGPPPPLVGNAVPGEPFDVTLVPGSGWGARPLGRLAVPNPAAADFAPSTLNCFVHGSSHSDLRVPFRLNAWLTNNARLVMHLNSVSQGAVMVVSVDGSGLFRTNLPNLDGTWLVNNEYNLDIPVNLPAGKHLVEISNGGADWFYLDWVRLERVAPSVYSPEWQPSPEAIGLRGKRESLVYAVAPGVSFPAGATNTALPLQQGQRVVITNWADGDYSIEWYDPLTAARVAKAQAQATNNLLSLDLPGFREDLAGVVYGPPALKPIGFNSASAFEFRLDSETGGRYVIEKTSQLGSGVWEVFMSVTNTEGTSVLEYPPGGQELSIFLRARHSD